jgi:hypothetical protein
MDEVIPNPWLSKKPDRRGAISLTRHDHGARRRLFQTVT